jgi:hypothetical protein
MTTTKPNPAPAPNRRPRFPLGGSGSFEYRICAPPSSSAAAPKQAYPPATGHTHSSFSSSIAGHEFKADFYGDGGITDPGLQTATEFLFGKRLSIEKERLLIDGREAAKIPAASRVEIVLSNSTLSVTADGTNVLSRTIQK